MLWKAGILHVCFVRFRRFRYDAPMRETGGNRQKQPSRAWAHPAVYSAVVILGFGLYRGVNSNVYLSAYAFVKAPFMFVPDLFFNVVVACSIIVCSAVAVTLAWTGRLKANTMPYVLPTALLLAGNLAALLGVILSLPPDLALLVPGLLYGAGSVMLSLFGGWVESTIMAVSGGNIGRCVANAHSFFKIFQVIVLFPFAKLIVKATYLVVPGEDKKTDDSEYQLMYIGRKNIFSPATAVVEVTRELERMGQMASENLNRGMNCLITLDEEDITKVYQVEKYIDYLNHSITDYLVKVSQMTIPVDDAKSIGGLFHVVNDIERIGDHAENLADAAKMRMEENVTFSKEAQHEMGEMLERVLTILRYSIDMFSHNNREHMEEILDLEEHIDEMERQYQQSHVDRLTRNECTPEAGMIFSDVISGLERVADHATNIAFSILDEDQE